MRPIDQWGPRPCPRCGMPPMVYCKTSSGAVAGLPHRERWPEGSTRTPKTPEGRERKRERDQQRWREARERERQREEALAMERDRRAEIRRMPKDAALRARAQDVMADWRRRAA